MKKLDKVIPFRTAYEPHKPCFFNTEGESLTQQHFQEECDIKTIIKKHDRTGIISHVASGVAQYGDYSEINEYRESLDLINHAQESFDGLPSELRKMFNNNPGEFFEFATDPANAQTMVELGLALSPDPVMETPEKAPEKPEDPDVSEG